MSDIEWTDRVWNPVVGCSRVSAGCQHCYAERVAHRGMSPQHRGLTVMGAHGPRWTGEVRMLAERLGEPLRWRKPSKVFVNSMSDLFHEGVPFEFIAAVFGVMVAAPQHTFQVLTKRPERMKAFFAWAESKMLDGGDAEVRLCIGAADQLLARAKHVTYPSWPLPNVWLGVSCEDQATADERIPLLLECPAAVRWVSYEPALGPVLFQGRWLGQGSECPECGVGVLVDEDGCCACGADAMYYGLDWVVVGGESGPGARPFDLAWARSVIRQGRDAGMPVFVKQLGSWAYAKTWDEAGRYPRRTQVLGAARNDFSATDLTAPNVVVRLLLEDTKGGDMAEWPEDLRVRQWPAVVEQVRAELAKGAA